MSSRVLKVAASGPKEQAYQIEQSIMLDDGDDAHLERTPSSAGNRKKWTQSFWIKLNDSGDGYFGLYGFPGGSAVSWYNGLPYIQSDGNLSYLDNYGAGGYGGFSNGYVTFTTAMKDSSAWYHIVFIYNTEESTSTNRMKVFSNGVQCGTVTNTTYPAQNFEGTINTTALHTINQVQDGYYGSVQLAEYHFLDGRASLPAEFGETDDATGQWIPKEYEGGNYGTNGFYLKFASGAIGTDSSGNGNNLTTTNLANSDVVIDSPTNNFATFNPLDSGSNITLSQGNLRSSGSGWGDTFSTIKIPHTGKWYIELYLVADGNLYFGLWTDNYTDTDAGQGYGTGKQFTHSGSVSGGASGGYISGGTSTGDIVSMAVDCDAGKLYWAIDGTWGSSGNPATGANPGLTFTATDNYKINMAGASGHQTVINFGQNGTFNGTKTAQGNADGGGIGDFYYAPPSGFKALCSTNLPTPAVKNGTDHFNTVIYTGSDDDSVSRNVTGVGFQPDLVWIKKRNGASHHVLVDAVRGDEKALNTSQDAAEVDDAYGVEAFLTDGFTVREHATAGGQVNTGTLVSWNWKAGGSTSANTSGDINSTVSVNNTAGFSIVTYTGNRTGAGVSTVGHGLSSAPKVVITKSRSNATNWWMQHPSTTSASHLLRINEQDQPAAQDDKSSNGTLSRPTSTVFGTNWTDGLGTNGHTMVAYCWAEVEGYSKFGSFRGNGNANGPFVYTGFRPAYLMIKKITATGRYVTFDTVRNTYNPSLTILGLNSTYAESTWSGWGTDILSNGFKLKTTETEVNANNQTMIYMAFAEAPVKYANAR